MEYISLRNSELTVSRFCMGGCPMGAYGWGQVSEAELIDSVHAALDHGVNFFDTADTYGLGQSERTLAKALGTHRRDVVIETKFGVRTGGGKTVYDNSPAYIRSALEASLQRLKTDWVDIYLIHYRDGITPLADVVAEMERLRQEGKIRYFGLSNVHMADIAEYLPFKGQFVCCQDEYSLACRKNETDLTHIRKELDLTPMTWGSLGQGILSGKYTKDSIFGPDDRRSREIYVNFHGEKLQQNMRIVEVLKEIAAERHLTPAACAIRFILDWMDPCAVLAGIKHVSQLQDNLDAFGWHLTADEMERLNQISSDSLPHAES